MNKTVYIGLGSNLNQPYLQIKNAIKALADIAQIKVIKNSGYYSSKPMGPSDQPDYVNAVVEIETTLSANDLLLQCQKIEQQQGRIKQRHWGERSIDLDILLYEQEQIDSKNLTVPHPGICLRDFVYMPLLKLDNTITIPNKGLLANIINNNNTDDAQYNCRYVGSIE